jgi:hypothetical protein
LGIVKFIIMKYIITEEQYKRFAKGSMEMQNVITKYLNKYISKGTRKIGKKSRNYGNLREDWCVEGIESITAVYYFEGDKFESGSLLVSKNIVNTIELMFSVKKSFIMHVIEEWYEETMVPKLESIVGETGLYINHIDTSERDHDCLPEPTKPEGITDEQMIDFIYNNTAYGKSEIMDLINTGERDLEDFYLDVVDTVNRKEQLGF